MEEVYTCPDGQSGRADKLLAEKYTDFSRGFIKQSIEDGKITPFANSSIMESDAPSVRMTRCPLPIV